VADHDDCLSAICPICAGNNLIDRSPNPFRQLVSRFTIRQCRHGPPLPDALRYVGIAVLHIGPSQTLQNADVSFAEPRI
jgi:hypothetical protein